MSKEITNKTTKKNRHRSILYAFKVMGKGRLWLVISILALICALTASYMSPLVSGYAVDSVIGDVDTDLPAFLQDLVDGLGGKAFFKDSFWVLPIIVVLLTVINGIFLHIRGKTTVLSAEYFAKNMRDKLYRHLDEVPFDYHKHAETGDIIQRCTSDVQTVRRFLSGQLIHIVRTVAMVTVASYIMFSINVKLAAISICLLPILCIGGLIYFKHVRKVFERVDSAEGKLSAVLQENASGVRVVRAFAQQKSELDKFTSANNDLKNKFNRFYTMMGFYWGVSDGFGYIQTLLTLGFGIVFVVNGSLTLGQFLIFNTYSGMLIWPVKQLGRVLADLGKATVALDRIGEILDAEPEKEPGKALVCDMHGDIVFSHVCFGYDGDDNVLSDVSFTAQRGETIAILGSTGSGKSSLVQLLQRLYPVKSGEITINGINVNDIESHCLRSNIGIVLQEPYLYSRTIMENIKITNPEASDDDVFEAAKIAAIHDNICSFDKGYETMVGDRGVTLSGGQKQRVAIARVLVQKTPVLIFDDSLSAVDTETDMAIRNGLNKSKSGATTFIISHRITTLCQADKIIVLDGGKLVQVGTHNELIKQEGIYRNIAEIQDMAKPVEKGSDK